jgi:hypothetical protein
MPLPSDLLTPSQLRAYGEVMDCCRRAMPHLQRLRIAGVANEQDEQRLQHLMAACEGILQYEEQLKSGQG